MKKLLVAVGALCVFASVADTNSANYVNQTQCHQISISNKCASSHVFNNRKIKTEEELYDEIDKKYYRDMSKRRLNWSIYNNFLIDLRSKKSNSVNEFTAKIDEIRKHNILLSVLVTNDLAELENGYTNRTSKQRFQLSVPMPMRTRNDANK